MQTHWQQAQYSLSIPTEGHPDIIGVVGDLVGAEACEAAEEKPGSERGDTAWKKWNTAGQHHQAHKNEEHTDLWEWHLRLKMQKCSFF